MRKHCTLIALLLVLPAASAQNGWRLVWSDEFNGPANSRPDSAKWTYDLGAGGWGNNELQTYTSSAENAFLDGNGNLVIRALRTGVDQYTSARLKTLGKLSMTYGRVEARIRIPYGQGIWSGFWMLGNALPSVGWPRSGEIDIMENIGYQLATVHGTVHGPGFSGTNSIGASYTLASGEALSDDFHIYSAVWTPDSIEFYMDSVLYQRVTPASLPPGGEWIFTKPFFLLLNIAIGGDWPGYPDASTTFPQSMTVDYVRVYSDPPAINPNGVVNAASFLFPVAPGSLASIFGTGLADTASADLFDLERNAFRQSGFGTMALVNGVSAPLTYVSAEQINFQIPWETPFGTAVPVQVVRNGIASNAGNITLTATSPSAFGVGGVALLYCVGGVPRRGTACALWGNGFGLTNPRQQNGVPATPQALTVNTCRLTVNGISALVTYCGAAPTLVIPQLNFIYPSGVPLTNSPVPATLTIGNLSGELRLPPPQ